MARPRTPGTADRWSTILLSLALTALIAVVGALAGPTWSAVPASWEIPRDSPRLDIVPRGSGPLAPPATYAVERHELTVDLGETSVEAWIFAPVGAPRGPGVVFIHGAGTGEPDAFSGQVRALAARGIRAMVPAKRMDTYSTRERDYEAMAADYLASWRVLRQWPGVDPTRVGVYGESERAWIAPIAAAAEPEVSFAVLASAPVVTPREQAAYAVANYLAHTNVPHGLFRSIPRALGATIPGGGFDYIDFDVRPFYRAMDQPVLMLYGTADASMPIVQGVQVTRGELAAGGNPHFTARYFAGADHGLRDGEHLAAGVTTVLTDWVGGLPGTAETTHAVAGAAAEQRFLAGPVPEPAWYASGNFLVYSVLAVVGLNLIGLGMSVAAAWGRRGRTRVHRHAGAAVLAAFAIVSVFLGYVSTVADLAVNYQTNDALIRGGW